MTLPARVSLVTLGARDVPALSAFYERLGWEKSSASNEHVSFFRTGGAVLAVWGRDALAEDAKAGPAGDGFRGVALAANVPEREDVDAALSAVMKAGGKILKPAEDTFWGGRSGYFADPEGHVWEVAWNPGFPLEADGRVRLPE